MEQEWSPGFLLCSFTCRAGTGAEVLRRGPVPARPSVWRGLGAGDCQEGVFVFWGTTAEDPHREELGACSEPVLILTSPNPHNPPAAFVMTRSFQPWLLHPGEALSPTLGVTSSQHLWAARGPSHSAVQEDLLPSLCPYHCVLKLGLPDGSASSSGGPLTWLKSKPPTS